MGLTWTSWAIPGILTLLAAWTGAAVLIRTSPHRTLNRRLGLLLALEGLWLGCSFFFMIEDPELFRTVGAVLTGIFFSIEYLLQQIVPVDDVILGLAASAGIVVALRPVQWLARAVADRVMADVEESREYVRGRKRVVYRAALEGAMEDGTLTEKERAILDRLSGELEIPDRVARQLEREMAVPSASPQEG